MLIPGKYLISYEEIKRRLQAPEKMSLRSLAAYTRVSRGPASKKTLLESLNVLGLTPSTTTSVSSSFSKLTEGDGKRVGSVEACLHLSVCRSVTRRGE